MTMFWIICAVLLLIALLFVIVPLLRNTTPGNTVVRDAANLEILRDQMAEMDADLANGLLTPERYEQGKRELQSRLLDEVKQPQGGSAGARNPHKALAAAIAVLLPALAIGLYLKLGNENAFLPQDKMHSADGFGMLSDDAVKKLQDKLNKHPEDPEGWLLLARSYANMERFAESAQAYSKLTQLVPDEAQLWADYADSVAMTQDQSLLGAPSKLLDKALSLDPNNPKALALAGSADMERGDYPAAIRHWTTLLGQLPDKNSEEAQMVAQGIEQARAYLGQVKGGKMAATPPAPPPATAPGAERISGTVQISAALKGQIAPDDTVFILARAAEGPPMPLAVLRKQAKDLPLSFTLDDSMAMSPQMKISSFDRIVVVARVSKSGNAMPQAGDLQGVSQAVKRGASGVKVSIDAVVR
jgi:cytochrome c-type biogenesis protein CcmH